MIIYSINYDLRHDIAKKTAGRDLTELTRGSRYWSVHSGKLWRVVVRVARSPRAQSTSAVTALFTTIK